MMMLCRLILFFLFISLSACGATTSSFLKIVGLGSNNRLEHISIEAVANSNLNSAAAVDLVFIKDEKIASLLSVLSGPKWFQDKAGLIKRYNNEIDLISLEIVPLSYLQSVPLPSDSKYASSILMFINYRSSDGQYVAELSDFKRLNIRLLRLAYQLQEQGE